MNAPALLLLSALSSGQPAISFDRCDFGERYQFEAARCVIHISNSGSKPVRLYNITSLGTTDQVAQSELIVRPLQSAELGVDLNLNDALGDTQRFVRADTDSDRHQITFVMRGFVLSDLDDASQRLAFGAVKAGSDSEPRQLELSSHETADFRIWEIVDKPEWIDARKSDDSHSVIARVKADSQWGLHRAVVKLKINTPHQKFVDIPVSADVRGNVVPDSNPRDLGTLRVGDANEFRIRLSSEEAKDFKVGNLESTGTPISLSQAECIPVSAGCRMIVGRLRDTVMPGAVSGIIVVSLPDYKRTLSIAFGGLLAARETKIVSVDSAGNAIDGHASETPVAALPPPPFDLKSAVRQAVTRSESAVPPGEGPLLSWQVANELQVYGYNIYRSDSEGGPFVRVNSDVIKTLSLDGSGWSYHWRDASTTKGKTYWYYVGVIYRSGVTAALSGHQKALSK